MYMVIDDICYNYSLGYEIPPDTKTLYYIYENRYKPYISLPDILPECLQRLICHESNLTSIPNLPSGLIIVNCNYNKLTELPPIPLKLISLQCNHNNIIELPELPYGLEILDCSHNPIKYISQENYNVFIKIERLCWANLTISHTPVYEEYFNKTI